MKTVRNQYRQLTSSSDQLIVRFDKDHLKEILQKQHTNVRLEVVKNNKIGYASSTSLIDPLLKTRALESSVFGDIVSYSFPKVKHFPKIQLESEKIRTLKSEYFITLGKELIESLKAINQNILVTVRLAKSDSNRTLELSSGTKVSEKETGISISVEGELVTEGDILSIGNYFFWRDLTFDKKLFIETLTKKFLLSQTIKEISSGKYPVIFTPEAFSSLLNFLETALSAENVFRKISKWTNELEKEVIDKRITIVDDPTIDFAPNSTAFDDEGFALSPFSFMEKGTLKNFYTDLKNASKLKIKPNGRGFGVPGSPQTTNVIISGGEINSKKMIKNISKGILIDEVIGGGQDSPYTGDFSLNIHLGFLIESGEIVGRVKNCLVSGNIFDMLKNNVREISSDREWVGGAYIPHISFENTNIVGK